MAEFTIDLCKSDAGKRFCEELQCIEPSKDWFFPSDINALINAKEGEWVKIDESEIKIGDQFSSKVELFYRISTNKNMFVHEFKRELNPKPELKGGIEGQGILEFIDLE